MGLGCDLGSVISKFQATMVCMDCRTGLLNWIVDWIAGLDCGLDAGYSPMVVTIVAVSGIPRARYNTGGHGLVLRLPPFLYCRYYNLFACLFVCNTEHRNMGGLGRRLATTQMSLSLFVATLRKGVALIFRFPFWACRLSVERVNFYVAMHGYSCGTFI